jgi:hypothetical protein
MMTRPKPLLAAAVLLVMTACTADGASENTLSSTTTDAGATTAEINPTTTAAPDVETLTDLEVIEAFIAALYSGNAERAAELFETSSGQFYTTDDEIREEAAYQAAIGGRLTLNCTEQPTPGTFSCRVPYHNAMTDAIGHVDQGDTVTVVVEDGVITEFWGAFPVHSFIVHDMGTFLASEGRFEGYWDCLFRPFPASCGTIQRENLDAWVQWREKVDMEPADYVHLAVESWYRGDCQTAIFFAKSWIDCSASSTASQTMEYESILGAQVSVKNCGEPTAGLDGDFLLSCEVHYSNAMNAAVGKPPSVTTREFTVFPNVDVPDAEPWYEGDYPEDAELRESFRLFAEGGELRDEYVAAGCASARTPECANLILDNLDDWAAWYETNG